MSALRLLAGLVAAAGFVTLWLWSPAVVAVEPARQPPRNLGPVGGFVENLGQWPVEIAFAAATGTQWLHVRHDRLDFGHGETRFTMTPTHHGAGVPVGMSATAAVCHFLLGSDPRHHHLGAAVYSGVRLPDVAPGVDLLARRAAGPGSAAFAYDLHLRRDARITDIEFRVSGCDSLSIDAATGELVVARAAEELRHSAPRAWLEHRGRRSPVTVRFELRGVDRFGFAAEIGDLDGALCIDPDLQWATCFGGSALDQGHAIAVAQNGDVFVAGSTQSTDLPTSFFAFDPTYNGSWPAPTVIGDAYVARLAGGNGALLWCTYLGGSENDRLIAVGAVGGEPIVTGWTTSTDFPTTAGAFDTSHNGTGNGYQYTGGDVFVTRVSANGQSLIWSSYLGGNDLEYPLSMAVAENGEVAVSGHVHSSNFPVTPGAFATTRLTHSDLFLSRFAADGASLLGSTYFGGSDGEEYPFALALLPDGDLVVAGATDSTDLPVTANAYDPTFNGGSEHQADGFVARFDATASALRWCTYLGTPANEFPRGVAVAADGSLTFTGTIDGPGLPTTGAVFGPAPFGGRDGFAWQLSGDGSTSVWASYVGGSLEDRFERCVALGGGRIAVAGRTASPDAPLTRGSTGTATLGGGDAWLTVLRGDGSVVDYGAAIGSPYGDRGSDVQVTPTGSLVTTGTLYWTNFPVTAGGRPYAGGGDAFVVQVAGLPQGVARFGNPSGACGRGARVMARSGPFVGEAEFALTAGTIPPGSPTLAAVSFAGLTAAQPLPGVDLWVDPGAILVSPIVSVDPHGLAVLPLAIPNAPGFAGLSLAVQFLWLDSCPTAVLGASDAVSIVIQP